MKEEKRGIKSRQIKLSAVGLLGLSLIWYFVKCNREIDSRFSFVDLSPCANADYHHNAFFSDARKGSDHYPGLRSGTYRWRGVPLRIADSFRETRHPSVITTGSDAAFVCKVPLAPSPSTGLYLAMDGAWIKKESRIARLRALYQDASVTEKDIIARRDVWTYSTDKNEAEIPSGRIFWENSKGQKIVVVPMPLAADKIPESLEIIALPAQGLQHHQPAIAIFAVTQALARTPSEKQ